jgi:spore coat polysaccharide biosynthesis protein SpsF
MAKTFKTDQEAFWAGKFGKEYSRRNVGSGLLAGNCALFAQILRRTQDVRSIIEFGANVGLNLRALKVLAPAAAQAAIEINPDAAKALRESGHLEVFESSILDFVPKRTWDLVLVKGVLIHINPEKLGVVYKKLFESSARYIVVAEYYNPTPVTVPYRGNVDRLFKRDFAGEILDAFASLKLLDYGFSYHRDPNFPQDDITWFLLEKRA